MKENGRVKGIRPENNAFKIILFQPTTESAPVISLFYAKIEIMTSEVLYTGNLSTTCTHLRSGTQIVTDAPVDNQGRGEAFSPTDLVATALGACIMTIMGIKARDKGIDIEGAKAEVNKIMGSNPRRIAKVEIRFTMPGKNYTEEQKKILEEAGRTCPVCKSLGMDCEQAVEFVW